MIETPIYDELQREHFRKELITERLLSQLQPPYKFKNQSWWRRFINWLRREY